MEIEMTYLTVGNVNIAEDMVFDDLTIPGDDSDCGILEEERETTSLCNIVWVKLKRQYGEVD